MAKQSNKQPTHVSVEVLARAAPPLRPLVLSDGGETILVDLPDHTGVRLCVIEDIPDGLGVDPGATGDYARLFVAAQAMRAALIRFIERDRAEMEASARRNNWADSEPKTCECGCCQEARAAIVRTLKPKD